MLNFVPKKLTLEMSFRVRGSGDREGSQRDPKAESHYRISELGKSKKRDAHNEYFVDRKFAEVNFDEEKQIGRFR